MTTQTIRFQAVGDIAFGDHPLCAGFGTHSRCRKRQPGFAFERVAATLRDCDLLFGNLECTLSEHGLRQGDYSSIQMRGHPHYLEGLVDARFAVLNLANNHSLQHGERAFQETVGLLRERSIEPCGLAAADHRHCTPAFASRNGVRVGFLGYSLRPRQYFTKAPIYAEGDRQSILADVAQARALCQSLVVSLHWGDEFIQRPSPAEIELARAIIDAGADLIIGHHPHVLRGVERYGRGYIVYSLGNFVCDMLWDETLRETAIVRCTLSPEGVRDFSLLPVRINDDYQPVLLEGLAREQSLSRLASLSDELQRAGVTAPLEGEEQYNRAADEAHRRARAKSHRYFLRKAYRFPPGIVYQQLRTFVRNRLAERGLIKQDSASMTGC